MTQWKGIILAGGAGGGNRTGNEEFAVWEVFDEVASKLKNMRTNSSYFN